MVMDRSDLARWEGLLKQLRINAANPMRFLHLAGEVIYRETMDSFKHERSPEGKVWPDLQESTRKRRKPGEQKMLRTISTTGVRVRGRSRHAFLRGSYYGGKKHGEEWEQAYKILQDRGTLRGSIVQKYSRVPPYVAVGSNLPYSRIQQLGGKTGRGHRTTLPPRPYLPRGLTRRMRREITAALVAQIRAGGAGRYVR
jgi:phage gpG-like protein